MAATATDPLDSENIRVVTAETVISAFYQVGTGAHTDCRATTAQKKPGPKGPGFSYCLLRCFVRSEVLDEVYEVGLTDQVVTSRCNGVVTVRTGFLRDERRLFVEQVVNTYRQ